MAAILATLDSGGIALVGYGCGGFGGGVGCVGFELVVDMQLW